MDVTSPTAFFAAAIVAAASWALALALADKNIRQMAIAESVFSTASRPFGEERQNG
jgi:hypothetical protein